jgi:hypothetical protein
MRQLQEENNSEASSILAEGFELGAVCAFPIDNKTDRVILCLASKYAY